MRPTMFLHRPFGTRAQLSDSMKRRGSGPFLWLAVTCFIGFAGGTGGGAGKDAVDSLPPDTAIDAPPTDPMVDASVDASPCDSPSVYPPDVTMTGSKPVPALSKPAYLAPVDEPTFGTALMRITDASTFGQSGVRHAYSKVQPWNSDGTLIIMDNILLDGNTYKLKSTTFPRAGDMRWSHVDPNKIFGFGRGRAVSINATTQESTTIATYMDYPWDSSPSNGLGFGEGNISWDDKYAAIATKDSSGELVIKVLNIQTGVFESSKTFLGKGSLIDWISMSPSGKYVVIQWNNNTGTTSYDRVALSEVVQVFTYSEHADLGFDMSGNEVLVQVVCGGTPDTSRASVMLGQLDTGVTTVALSQFPGHYCGHASTRNYKRPGWAYFSDGGPTGDIYALKLDGSQTVERFAHTRTTASLYEAQAKAVPNPCGTKVIFTSDWGVAGREVNDYVVWQK